MEYPDKAVAQERAEIIGELQSRIMDEYNASCEGKVMQVLCDGYDPDEECYYGRTYADSPDIDGRIWFTASRHIKTGDFVNVFVVGISVLDAAGHKLGERHLGIAEHHCVSRCREYLE